MTPTPKTIQIFLPGGDPQGIRVAEITTRIVQVKEKEFWERALVLISRTNSLTQTHALFLEW